MISTLQTAEGEGVELVAQQLVEELLLTEVNFAIKYKIII